MEQLVIALISTHEVDPLDIPPQHQAQYPHKCQPKKCPNQPRNINVAFLLIHLHFLKFVFHNLQLVLLLTQRLIFFRYRFMRFLQMFPYGGGIPNCPVIRTVDPVLAGEQLLISLLHTAKLGICLFFYAFFCCLFRGKKALQVAAAAHVKKSVCLDQFRFLEFEAGDRVLENADAEVFYIRRRRIIITRFVACV